MYPAYFAMEWWTSSFQRLLRPKRLNCPVVVGWRLLVSPPKPTKWALCQTSYCDHISLIRMNTRIQADQPSVTQ
jgi:hypothetical protein